MLLHLRRREIFSPTSNLLGNVDAVFIDCFVLETMLANIGEGKLHEETNGEEGVHCNEVVQKQSYAHSSSLSLSLI